MLKFMLLRLKFTDFYRTCFYEMALGVFFVLQGMVLGPIPWNLLFEDAGTVLNHCFYTVAVLIYTQ